MKREQAKISKPLMVLLFEAKPNRLFTEDQRACVRFLRYNQPVPCAECGKRSKAPVDGDVFV